MVSAARRLECRVLFQEAVDPVLVRPDELNHVRHVDTFLFVPMPQGEGVYCRRRQEHYQRACDCDDMAFQSCWDIEVHNEDALTELPRDASREEAEAIQRVGEAEEARDAATVAKLKDKEGAESGV